MSEILTFGLDLAPIWSRLDHRSAAFVMAGPTGVFGKAETRILR